MRLNGRDWMRMENERKRERRDRRREERKRGRERDRTLEGYIEWNYGEWMTLRWSERIIDWEGKGGEEGGEGGGGEGETALPPPSTPKSCIPPSVWRKRRGRDHPVSSLFHSLFFPILSTTQIRTNRMTDYSVPYNNSNEMSGFIDIMVTIHLIDWEEGNMQNIVRF